MEKKIGKNVKNKSKISKIYYKIINEEASVGKCVKIKRKYHKNNCKIVYENVREYNILKI